TYFTPGDVEGGVGTIAWEWNLIEGGPWPDDYAVDVHNNNPLASVLKYRSLISVNPQDGLPEDWYLHDDYLWPYRAHIWTVDDGVWPPTDSGSATTKLSADLDNVPSWRPSLANDGTRHVMRFDGSDDHVMLAGSCSECSLVGMDYTISAWFKFGAQPSGGDSVILQGGFGPTYVLKVRADGRIEYIHVTDDNPPLDLISPPGTSYLDGDCVAGQCNSATAWHQVAVVVENNGLPRSAKLYVDGVLRAQQDDFGWLQSSGGPLWIGAPAGVSFTPNGMIDEIQMYKGRALSQMEAYTNFGHRLVNDFYCINRIDVAAPGWIDFQTSELADYFATHPAVDGVYADEAVDFIPLRRWHAKVENEKAVVASDGTSVQTEFAIWDGSPIGTALGTKACDHGVVGVWTDPQHGGTNYQASPSGYTAPKTINLASPMTPGSRVYVSYFAIDRADTSGQGGAIEPTPTKISSFKADLGTMIDAFKLAIGPRTLILNANSMEYVGRPSVDGKENEAFLVDKSLGAWQSTLDDERDTVAQAKVYIAQAQELDDGPLRFDFGSHLLAYDPTYSYFAYNSEKDNQWKYGQDYYYTDFEVALGLPQAPMSVEGQGDYRQNKIAQDNPSFEEVGPGGVPENWTALNPGATSDDMALPSGGSHSLHVAATQGAQNVRVQSACISIDPNVRLEISGWFRGENITSDQWWRDLGAGFFWYSDES
ncbi:MAG TPA: LamG domain-containing protein, partial [Fimbriimonadaceae bacterium]|nr:LamG domain-containing protein [Fimbriimonadaceae bacterium]